MKIATYVLLACLIFGVFKTHRTVRQSQNAQERFFAIRMSAFTWLVSLLLLGAFLFLPNRQRALLILPAFLLVVTVVKIWQNTRARLQRERQEKVDLERMKRVN